MIVSNFSICRAWATSLTHHNGHIEGSSLSRGVAAAVAAAATAVLGACSLQRNASLRDKKAPETLLLGTATTAIVVVGVTTITSILLGG